MPLFHSAEVPGNVARQRLSVVRVNTPTASFPIVNQAWRGDMDPDRPGQITWTDLGEHPGPPRYRAAGGTAPDGTLLFHGGTDTPYNFDGLAYVGGQPSPTASEQPRVRFEAYTSEFNRKDVGEG